MLSNGIDFEVAITKAVSKFGIPRYTIRRDVQHVLDEMTRAAATTEVQRAYAQSVAMGKARIESFAETITILRQRLSWRVEMEGRKGQLFKARLETTDRETRANYTEDIAAIEEELAKVESTVEICRAIAYVLTQQGKEHLNHDRRLKLNMANENWQLRIAGLLEDGVCPPDLAQLLVTAMEDMESRILNLASAHPTDTTVEAVAS